MSEIPMPGDYGTSESRGPQQDGFCSQCCEVSCKAVLACIFIIVVIFIFLMILLGSPF